MPRQTDHTGFNIDSFTKKVNKLAAEISTVQAKLEAYNWLPSPKDFEAELINKQIFTANIVNQLQILLEGISRYPDAVRERSPYLQVDNRYSLKLLKDVRHDLDKFRDKIFEYETSQI